jgi:hypothetical protein
MASHKTKMFVSSIGGKIKEFEFPTKKMAKAEGRKLCRAFTRAPHDSTPNSLIIKYERIP